MPWNNIEAVPSQFKTHQGVDLNLDQANHAARIYDELKKSMPEGEAMAVMWSTFKKVYLKEGDQWVKNNQLNTHWCKCVTCGKEYETEKMCNSLTCGSCNGQLVKVEDEEFPFS